MKRRSRWIPSLLFAILLLVFAGNPLEAQEVHDDPDARALLEGARQHLVVWDRFPGFKATLEVDRDGKRSGGELTVLPSGKVEVELQDREAAEWASGILKSIVNHRLKMDTHKHEEAPVAFGPEDQHPLGRMVKKGDRSSSTYRIKGQQILQVNQRIEKGWLSLNVLEYVQTLQGFLSKRVAIFQFDEKGSLVKSTVFTDEYVEVERLWLPKSRMIISAQGGKIGVSTLQFQEHRLLPKEAAKAPAP
ncbi:DUF3386 family protein [Candidatus Methylomirabilis sp.]|uniref:DUF3386 domain-containing protein n=1 Tax=Candidatus Methylomirabilis tolerans TaxID=3123416 RepID=A0AAJ1AGE3_9BACT|nr:DUF3386 domain-containing protein [Candidatus Methylomirabilis sp.]